MTVLGAWLGRLGRTFLYQSTFNPHIHLQQFRHCEWLLVALSKMRAHF